MSWSTSELRVRLAPLNRFKPSSKIFYWPFQGGTSFVDLLCFCSVLYLLCFVRVCLYVLCGHLLGKGWPLGSRLWCLLWVCHFPIGILGQVWYLIVSIPDLCTLTYLERSVKYFTGGLKPVLPRHPRPSFWCGDKKHKSKEVSPFPAGDHKATSRENPGIVCHYGMSGVAILYLVLYLFFIKYVWYKIYLWTKIYEYIYRVKKSWSMK